MVLIQTKDFDQILNDSLSRFYEKYDVRQGSTLQNLAAAIAQEIAIQYMYLEEYSNTQFLDTAYGEGLTRLASQFGVDRMPASAAQREAFFIESIPIGTRFSIIDADANFIVTEDNGGGMYFLGAEELGAEGNFIQGELLNIDPLDTFSGAVLGRVVIAGEDEESDDDLRERTAARVRAPSLYGTVAQYEVWARDFEGVGSVKIEPLWNGANTVKVSITNAAGAEASAELVALLQEYLDPEPRGHGLGVAPIGAVVTVESINAVAVTIEADIRLDIDFELSNVEELIRNELQIYLAGEAFNDSEIKVFKVLTVIDRVQGIRSVDNVKINGSTSSLPVDNGVPAILQGVVLNDIG